MSNDGRNTGNFGTAGGSGPGGGGGGGGAGGSPSGPMPKPGESISITFAMNDDVYVSVVHEHHRTEAKFSGHHASLLADYYVSQAIRLITGEF